MQWRHLGLSRAAVAAGLVSGLMFIGVSIATAQTERPAVPDPEASSPAAVAATETVDLLQSSKSGDLDVVARGHGQERVHLTMRNLSARRLNVIIPPGLVAASTVGQPAGAGGRGLQSMGLGSVSNREGAFGEFRATSPPAGLHSMGVTEQIRSRMVTVPVGETIKLTLPSVCLNYGLPTPTPRHTFRLMDVDQYSSDPRVRTALRSLATYGTSLGVAQAVMWRVCNDLPFELMAEQTGKVMNIHEIALAARFVEALDSSHPGELVDTAQMSESRIFVQVRGEGSLSDEARRLSGELGGSRILGLPLQLVESEDLPTVAAPALFLSVVLTDAKLGDTRGRIVVSSCSDADSWLPLGKVSFRENSSISVLDGATLSKTIDRAIASAFVTVKPARRSLGSTTLRVDNRLPFTISSLVVKAGSSAGSPSVPFESVGIGPARSALLPIQAATASVVERVELNGL
jgi:hypothetical protein